MLLNGLCGVHSRLRNRPTPCMRNLFIKCVPLEAASVVFSLSNSLLSRALKATLLINSSFRSATLHIPQEMAGLLVGVRLFIIFQIKMSLGAPLKLLICFKRPLLMVLPLV